MNAISWNCRGLAATSTVQELKDLCFRVKPAIMFLMETRAKESKVNEIRVKLKFDNMFCVEPKGLAGGLCLFWSKEVEVEIIAANRNYIHTLCRSRNYGDSWDCTFIYGNPHFNDRKALWGRVSVLHHNQNSPWMCFGDFNEILNQEEKIGLHPHGHNKMNLFREFLDEAGLMDLEVKGCKFTWTSNPRNDFITRERIDRLLVNWEWRQMFPNAILYAIPPVSSDHSPLILHFKPKVGDGGRFKYEAYWDEHVDCDKTIKRGWNKELPKQDPWDTLFSRLSSCKKELKTWSASTFKNAAREIPKLKEKLATILNGEILEADTSRISGIKDEIRGSGIRRRNTGDSGLV